MKKDTQDCLNKIIRAIDDKDKLAFENYMTSFYIKAKRDIKEVEVKKECDKIFHEKQRKIPFNFFCNVCAKEL